MDEPTVLSPQKLRKLKDQFLTILSESQEQNPDNWTVERTRQVHKLWMSKDRINQFLENLARMIQQKSSGVMTASLESVLLEAIRQRLDDHHIQGLSSVQGMEISRLASKAWLASQPESLWAVPSRYSIEIRATRKEDESILLAPIGQVLLGLTGRDAVRWLLAVEVAQSSGPGDDWRLSRETATALYPQRELFLREYEWKQLEERGEWPHSFATVRRLDAFGILQFTEGLSDGSSGSEVFGYRLSDVGRDLLKEVSGNRETPFKVLAQIHAEDDVSRSLTKFSPELKAVLGPSSASVSLKHARMMAHEVRNALVPVTAALEGLYRQVTAAGVEEIVEKYRPRIDSGIERTFRFVEEQLNITSAAGTAPEPFDGIPAVREAIVIVEGEGLGGGKIRLTLPVLEPMLPLQGHRQRFILALVNLLRNAVQVTIDDGDEPAVLLEVTTAGSNLILTLEDNGAGVPENLREAIFENGFSARSGGTGHGLALSQEVLEREMNGRIECGDSPLGGARFRVTLPTIGTR